MKRRNLLGVLGGAVAWPLVAHAQQAARVRRIGLLRYPSPQKDDLAALHEGLRDLGHMVGTNLLIEERYANGQPDRLPLLAAELARLKLELIIVDGTPSALAAKRALGTTPIIFVLAADPVGDGLANSLARPGGNLTGLTFSTIDLSQKRLQLLKDAIPSISRVGVLYNPRLSFAPAMVGEVHRAGQALGLRIDELPADRPEAFADAFAAAARTDALLTLTDGMFFAQRERIVELSLKHRLPALHPEREYVHAGGLMSYGPNLPHLWRLAATYIHKVLAGARVGDLPIEQPTKFELVINLKAASAMGIKFSEAIFARVDEVIGGQ